MPGTFRALRNRNYQLYFGGQLLSVIGTGIHTTAQAWLVYRISQSASWLGAISFCTQLPAFIAAPIAGIIADRHDRRAILIACAAISMVPAFVMSGLTFGNRISLFEIAALSIIMGISTAFEITTRHAYAADLVGKPDLSSALALNSISINGSRVIGPAFAGLVLGFVGNNGEAWCFLLNAISFLAVIYGLLLIPPRKMHHPVGSRFSPVDHFREGLSHVRQSQAILRLMAIATLISLVGFPATTLLPVFAKVILHGDARTLAWLSGLSGAGAVCGSLYSGSLGVPEDSREMEKWLSRSIFFLGIAMIFLGRSTWLPLSLSASFAVGFYMMGAFPRINHTIQSLVDDRMRGRVLSLYTMTFLGTMPIGNLVVGWLADRLGAQAVIMGIGGTLMTFGLGLYFLLGSFNGLSTGQSREFRGTNIT